MLALSSTPLRCSVLPRKLRPSWGEALASSGGEHRIRQRLLSTHPHRGLRLGAGPHLHGPRPAQRQGDGHRGSDGWPALIKAGGVNVETFWPGFSQRHWPMSTSAASPVGAGGATPAAVLHPQKVPLPPPGLPQLRRSGSEERRIRGV